MQTAALKQRVLHYQMEQQLMLELLQRIVSVLFVQEPQLLLLLGHYLHSHIVGVLEWLIMLHPHQINLQPYVLVLMVLQLQMPTVVWTQMPQMSVIILFLMLRLQRPQPVVPILAMEQQMLIIHVSLDVSHIDGIVDWILLTL